jgi:2-desacetyl-2-hydroxyethyl bacteriochlorophyllide A dehydrogenase
MNSQTASYPAAIFRGVGNVDVVELPWPDCGDDDVIIRNLLTGVCGSDVAAYRSGGDPYMIWKDHEFGHEAISEVVAVGRNVQGLVVGDRVFATSDSLRDFHRAATIGGFSQYIRIPQCELGYSLIRIDNDLPLRSAVLFEPFVIATRAVRGLQPGPGKSAVVFGAGIIGMASAIMLQWYGCDKVMVADFSDFRLAKARQLGLITCNPSREDLGERTFAEFGSEPTMAGQGCGARLFVDCVGATAVVNDFLRLAPTGGTLATVGVHHAPAEIDMVRLCFDDLRIIGCGKTKTADLADDILAMMRSGRYDLAGLVTHEYPVTRIAEALVTAADASSAQKVCISF